VNPLILTEVTLPDALSLNAVEILDEDFLRPEKPLAAACSVEN
jgi:hypothetical protein